VKLAKIQRGTGESMRGSHDSYAVAHYDWDNYPVISMNDKYTLYRSKLVENFFDSLIKISIIDASDMTEFADELDDDDMRVLLVYKMSENKTYLRFKHYANTHCLHQR